MEENNLKITTIVENIFSHNKLSLINKSQNQIEEEKNIFAETLSNVVSQSLKNLPPELSGIDPNEFSNTILSQFENSSENISFFDSSGNIDLTHIKGTISEHVEKSKKQLIQDSENTTSKILFSNNEQELLNKVLEINSEEKQSLIENYKDAVGHLAQICGDTSIDYDTRIEELKKVSAMQVASAEELYRSYGLPDIKNDEDMQKKLQECYDTYGPDSEEFKNLYSTWEKVTQALEFPEDILRSFAFEQNNSTNSKSQDTLKQPLISDTEMDTVFSEKFTTLNTSAIESRKNNKENSFETVEESNNAKQENLSVENMNVSNEEPSKSDNVALEVQDNSFIGKLKRLSGLMRSKKENNKSQGFFSRLRESAKEVFGKPPLENEKISENQQESDLASEKDEHETDNFSKYRVENIDLKDAVIQYQQNLTKQSNSLESNELEYTDELELE